MMQMLFRIAEDKYYLSYVCKDIKSSVSMIFDKDMKNIMNKELF
jgi:hypothetical protein